MQVHATQNQVTSLHGLQKKKVSICNYNVGDSHSFKGGKEIKPSTSEKVAEGVFMILLAPAIGLMKLGEFLFGSDNNDSDGGGGLSLPPSL